MNYRGKVKVILVAALALLMLTVGVVVSRRQSQVLSPASSVATVSQNAPVPSLEKVAPSSEKVVAPTENANSNSTDASAAQTAQADSSHDGSIADAHRQVVSRESGDNHERERSTQRKTTDASNSANRSDALAATEREREERNARRSGSTVARESVESEEEEGEENAAAKQAMLEDMYRQRAAQMKDENGEIPENALVRAYEQKEQMQIDPRVWQDDIKTSDERANGSRDTSVAGIDSAHWTSLGPGNIGGRIRAIVINPTAPNTMYIGSVGGGIWKTTDGGANWTPLNDFMANLAVTSLVMDPSNPNVIYAATGEGFSNSDGLRGAGIFKSTDAGANWTQLAATADSRFFYVSRLAIHPSNGQILLAATWSGIYRSTNGGDAWTQVRTGRILDIDFSADGSRAIASGDSFLAAYSTNSGQNWTNATGLPTSSSYPNGRSDLARIEVTYAKANSSLVYASLNLSSSEIWKSSDGGVSFTKATAVASNFLGGQGWYDNVIWAGDPSNANHVMVGGPDLWRSLDGGATLVKISQWQAAPSSAHADHHAIVSHPQYDGVTNKTVFFGNDGGIYKAPDVVTVSLVTGWTELNNNLSITQFYGAAGNATTGRIIGGTQDNGTIRYRPGVANPTESWNAPFGGDGGYAAYDSTDTSGNYFYGEYVYLNIHRSTTADGSSSYIYNGITDAVSGGTANFIAPFILDPNNPNRLLGGARSLWLSANVKATTPTWAAIKPPAASNSNISAIAVKPGDSNTIWVGHNNGAVYYTTDGGANWTQVAGVPARYIHRIAIDGSGNNRVYVTTGGFTSGNVQMTTNNGASWTSISGNLPQAPVRSITISPSDPNTLFVGTEVGIFASINGGATWSPSNDGPSNVSVEELFWMGNKLVAATHGRGLFSITPATGGNSAPLVSITSPTAGQTFTSLPASITINANASDSDGSITKVQFFNGTTLLNEDTTAPYSFAWSNVPAGGYTISARAFDNVGDAGDSIPVSIRVGAPLGANDNFANAEALLNCNGTTSNSTANATKEAGEPAPVAGSDTGLSGGKSIWYRWTAPSTGSVSFNTRGSSFDTLLGVFTGNAVNGLTYVTGNDDETGTTTSLVTFNATAGQTYRIVVDGYGGVGGDATLSFSQQNCTPAGATVQFASAAQSITEYNGIVPVQVMRGGDTSTAFTVEYRTNDDARLFNCNPVTAGVPGGAIAGVATARCDYTTTVGVLRFAAGETSKTISIPLSDDVHVEGAESFSISLRNPVGATLGANTTDTISVQDNDTSNQVANPSGNNTFFVRQHYLDFLGRNPTDAEVQTWVNVTGADCPLTAPDACYDRVWISGKGFFDSQEFQQKGYFVYRFYKALGSSGSTNRLPTYNEFIPDMVNMVDTSETQKNTFALQFTQRADFQAIYGALSNNQFVDTLIQRTGLATLNAVQMKADLNSGAKDRWVLLREAVESPEMNGREFNNAWVIMQYFGYLRRDGDPTQEYAVWINYLNANPTQWRQMINGFMNSTEYKQRFGDPIR